MKNINVINIGLIALVLIIVVVVFQDYPTIVSCALIAGVGLVSFMVEVIIRELFSSNDDK